MKTIKEFTKENLQEIIVLGAVGKTFSEIASNFGITSDILNDLRKSNAELDDALNRAQFNCDAFFDSKMRETILSGKSKSTLTKMYLEQFFKTSKYLQRTGENSSK